MPLVHHVCHARQCMTPVDPKMLMCKRHWYMVPKELRDKVWATYRSGQEVTKDPSMEYLDAAQAAVRNVAEQEGVWHSHA